MLALSACAFDAAFSTGFRMQDGQAYLAYGAPTVRPPTILPNAPLPPWLCQGRLSRHTARSRARPAPHPALCARQQCASLRGPQPHAPQALRSQTALHGRVSSALAFARACFEIWNPFGSNMFSRLARLISYLTQPTPAPQKAQRCAAAGWQGFLLRPEET